MNAFFDGAGATGATLHYALILFLVGGAFILFLFLWFKGKLDMDEAPKWQLFNDEDENERRK